MAAAPRLQREDGHLVRPPSPLDPWQVDNEHEQQALVAVQERLRQWFPDLDAAVIEAAVRVSHAEPAGPVRDFVPLLVERAARERPAFANQEPAPVGEPPTPPTTAQPLGDDTAPATGTSRDEPA
jgi:hypothetical protein